MTTLSSAWWNSPPSNPKLKKNVRTLRRTSKCSSSEKTKLTPESRSWKPLDGRSIRNSRSLKILDFSSRVVKWTKKMLKNAKTMKISNCPTGCTSNSALIPSCYKCTSCTSTSLETNNSRTIKISARLSVKISFKLSSRKLLLLQTSLTLC